MHRKQILVLLKYKTLKVSITQNVIESYRNENMFPKTLMFWCQRVHRKTLNRKIMQVNKRQTNIKIKPLLKTLTCKRAHQSVEHVHEIYHISTHTVLVLSHIRN